MRVFLEIGKGFKQGKDIFDHEIVDSFPTSEIVRVCSEQLGAELPGVEVRVIDDALQVIKELQADDRLVSVHGNIYAVPDGRGVQGFYRSYRKLNSEKCKSFSITVAKAFRDHTDLTYKGVYNETKYKLKVLDSIVITTPIACAIDIGVDEKMRPDLTNPNVIKNFGKALARGVIRYTNAIH